MSKPPIHERGGDAPEVFETSGGEMLGMRFDVEDLLVQKLGPEWQSQTIDVIERLGSLEYKSGDHHTVREPVGNFGLVMLAGDAFAKEVPGIWQLYQGVFKQMMQAALPPDLEPLHTYDEPLLALEPVMHPAASVAENTQHRYEAHVDQRYTAVLILDAPDPNNGGRLVISNIRDNPSLNSAEAIKRNATFVTHKSGTLFCFSQGRFFPHYTEEVTGPDRRATVSLNYPVEGEDPEEALKLTEHNLGLNKER